MDESYSLNTDRNKIMAQPSFLIFFWHGKSATIDFEQASYQSFQKVWHISVLCITDIRNGVIQHVS